MALWDELYFADHSDNADQHEHVTLPRWAVAASRNLVRELADGTARGTKGKLAKFWARYHTDHVHAFRYEMVAWLLKLVPALGQDGACEVIAKDLAETEAKGSSKVIKRSFLLMRKRLNEDHAADYESPILKLRGWFYSDPSKRETLNERRENLDRWINDELRERRPSLGASQRGRRPRQAHK